MTRFGQVGIAIGALGMVVALMGLFPGVTGAVQTPGIGIVQVMLLLIGYGLLIQGAILYVKFTFYSGVPSNLTQQIGVRLALTGLLMAALAGLADILGFGSHLRNESGDIFLGQLQAFGILASFTVSSFGVLLYAVAGTPRDESEVRDQEVTWPRRKLNLPPALPGAQDAPPTIEASATPPGDSNSSNP